MTDTDTVPEDAKKNSKGAWVAHNFTEMAMASNSSEYQPDRWFKLFGSELTARRYAMGTGNADVAVERLTWGEGRSE